MGKYLKLFKNHNEYMAFTQTEGYLLPNVSRCITEKDVHYNPITLPTQPLMVTYNVSDASQSTQLYYYYVAQNEGDPSATAVNMFDKVEIDGTEVSLTDLDAAEGMYQLSAGEHTVEYTLKDPTLIGLIYDKNTRTPSNISAVFVQCTTITDVTIPNTVTTIGEGSFISCTGLTSINIPSSVTEIGGNGVFSDCSNLTSVTFENGSQLTAIGQSAFDGCSSLTSINIPSSVTTIGNYAFCQCSSLDSASRSAISAINTYALRCLTDVQG